MAFSSQLSPGEFKEVMKTREPRLLICRGAILFEYSCLSNTRNPNIVLQVRNVLLDNRLAPLGTRPVVAIDEAQVCNGEISSDLYRV